MKKSIHALSAAALLALAGCSAHSEPDEQGEILMPLVSTSTTGTTYRLLGTFDVAEASDPTTSVGTVDAVANFADDPVARVRVDPGNYLVTLQDDWLLEVVDETGSTPADGAVLLTANQMEVDVAAGRPSELFYRFGVGDRFIGFGSGRIDVSIDVIDELTTYEMTGEFTFRETKNCDPTAGDCSVAIEGTPFWASLSYTTSLNDSHPSAAAGVYETVLGNGLLEWEVWFGGALETSADFASANPGATGTLMVGDTRLWPQLGSVGGYGFAMVSDRLTVQLTSSTSSVLADDELPAATLDMTTIENAGLTYEDDQYFYYGRLDTFDLVTP